MINKMVGSIIFVSCLFATYLFLNGVTAPVWFGNEFRAFIVATNQQLMQWKIAIPNIPHIPVEEVVTLDASGVFILDWFISFAKGFFNFINFLIDILNFLVLVINTIIQLLEFIFIFLRNLITMKNDIVRVYSY